MGTGTRGRGRPAGGHLGVDGDVVLDAAEQVIAQMGRAVSIDAIAAAAGITKPSVYARVGDRASLSDALAGRLVARLLAEAGPAVADGIDRDRLAALFTRTLEVLERDRELFFFVTRGASADAADRTLHLAHRSAEPLAVLLAQWRTGQGRDPTVALPWAYGIIGMLNMVALWWLDDGGSDAATVAGQLADLAWTGVRDD